MMKQISLFGIIATLLFTQFIPNSSYAKTVSLFDAERAALNFINLYTDYHFTDLELQSAYTNAGIRDTVPEGVKAFMYVFKPTDQLGFVIISADDRAFPLIAYSGKHSFDPYNKSYSKNKWMESRRSMIRSICAHLETAEEEVEERWTDLLQGTDPFLGENSKIGPLLSTEWGQDDHINEKCPYDYNEKENCLTGCVATAMAQIMRYHEWPPKGVGYYSYVHQDYGRQATSFDLHSYPWSSMPNEVDHDNNNVSEVISDCGVSVNMDYGVDGSGAYSYNVDDALVNHFRYLESTIDKKSKKDYNDQDWLDTLRYNFQNYGPVYYSGNNGEGTGGHAWVADGMDQNGELHMNWGWEGSDNGYYEIDDLTPGFWFFDSDFTHNQEMISGIQPESAQSAFNIRLGDDVKVSSQFYYNQLVGARITLENAGTVDYNGKIGLAIIHHWSDNFVQWLDEPKSISISAGQSSGELVFTQTASLEFVPAYYRIIPYFTGANSSIYEKVLPSSGFELEPEFDVISPNTWEMEMDTEMVIISGNHVIKSGDPVSVEFAAINKNTNDWNNGSLFIDLYDLDLNFAFRLDQIQNLSLASGAATGNLIATNPSVNVKAGRYLLVAMEWRLGYGNMMLSPIGQRRYQNPLLIDVLPPDPLPDKYEPNDITPTDLGTMQFDRFNYGRIELDGINRHVHDDLDIYKVKAESGYWYHLLVQLYDENNPHGQKEFTDDGVFQLSFDNGTTWSDVYDDQMPKDLIFEGGRDLWIRVYAFQSGFRGTYKLDIEMERYTEAPPIDTTEANSILTRKATDLEHKLFPNPTQDQLFLNLEIGRDVTSEISIYKLDGTLVKNVLIEGELTNRTLDISELGNGFHIVHIRSGKQQFRKKILVQR